MLELLKRGRPPPDEDGGADERVHFVDVGCGAGAVTNQVNYRVAHLLRERDMLTPNLKLRSAVSSSCDLGQ